MKNQKLQRTRLLSLVLTMVMLFSTLPSTVFATEGGISPNTIGLTECHQNHDADCGYTEAGTGVDCTHALSCDTLRVDENTNYTVAEAETGLFAGRFSHYQVFDCWRDPAEPVANSPLKVYKFNVPFNDIDGEGYQMNETEVKNKIFYFKPTDGANTFILYMADNVAGVNETAISRGGGIYALGKEGFLFITTQGSSKGYFISLSQGFNYGGELTYTPTENGPISADTAASLPGISSTPWDPNESWSVVFSSKDADKLATPSRSSVRKKPAPAKIGALPSSPEREGYDFAGWNTQENGKGTFIDSQTVLTADITVYAQWKNKGEATPTVKIEKPVFDATDIKKVTVGGSVTLGDNPIATQTFEIRKVGATNWTALNAGRENGKITTYNQLLDNLAGNTEYELRLTATDNANTTATTTLKFRTQQQNAATGGIIGSVDGGIETITVTLEMGNTVVASVKGLRNKNEFTFSNLADGEYNVVATDAAGRRVTMMASVKDGKTTRLSVMMVGKQQSSVEVKGNTPPVAVDGLQELFDSNTYSSDQDAINTIAANGTVEMRLTANEATVQSEIDAIRSRVGSDTIGLLTDLKVDMIITSPGTTGTVKNLKNVDGLLTVAVPLWEAASGKLSYKIYRHHNGAVETLKQIQSETDKSEGTFLIDGKYAYIYSSKFSTYAITYINGGSGGSSGSSSGSNKGNSAVVTPPVVEKPKTDKTGVADLLVTDQHVKYMTGYEKGNFNPTSNMTRAEVAQMFYNLMIDKNVEKTVSFNDVADSAWYAEAVNTLASMNILSGSDGNFRPDESITRGEFVAIAGRFSKMEKGDCTFSDVDENLWSYDAIAATSNYGWITGYEDNTFRPEQQISRAEVVVIVNNMLGRTPDKEYIDANKASLKSFTDTATPSYWAWYHIVEATNGHAHTFHQKEEKWTGLE